MEKYMSKIEMTREFPGLTADACFEMCVSSVEKIGYTLFKKRDIANLIICNGFVENANVDLSLSVPFSDPTSIRVNISSEKLDEKVLIAEADRILAIFSSNI